MANNTKHIEGGGKSGKKGFKEPFKKGPIKKPGLLETRKYQPKQKAFKKVNRGYVSSYLDLSVKTPGKYGVDY